MRSDAASILLLIFGSVLVGCQVGPQAVRAGRPNYNDAVHDTSRDQVFYNIIRVYHHDTTQFVDVSEVDATLQFQGTLTAAAMLPQAVSGGGGSRAVQTTNTNATAAGTSPGTTATTAAQKTSTANIPFYGGHDFSITGGLLYQESPTIRYIPLSGPALISQIATPISPDSLANLYDSDWPLEAILTMAADRITPAYDDYYLAINAIMDLDQYGAIVLAPEKSPNTAPVGKNVAGASLPMLDDTLVIYFQPDRLETFLNRPRPMEKELGMANSTMPALSQLERRIELARDENREIGDRANRLWTLLYSLYAPSQYIQHGASSDRDRISLRVAPAIAPDDSSTVSKPAMSRSTFFNLGPFTFGGSSASGPSDMPLPSTRPSPHRYQRAPVMRTRSALGILKASTIEDWDIIEFLSREEYETFVEPQIEYAKLTDRRIGYYRFDLAWLNEYADWKVADPKYKVDFAWFDQEWNNENPKVNTGYRNDGHTAWRHTPSSNPFPISLKLKQMFFTHDRDGLLRNNILEAIIPPAGHESDLLNRDYPGNITFDLPNGGHDFSMESRDLLSQRLQQNAIGESRHFVVIIEEGDSAFENNAAYVSYVYGGRRYSIDARDDVSKHGFALISQFLTMEAIAPPTPLTPTISVGAK